MKKINTSSKMQLPMERKQRKKFFVSFKLVLFHSWVNGIKLGKGRSVELHSGDRIVLLYDLSERIPVLEYTFRLMVEDEQQARDEAKEHESNNNNDNNDNNDNDNDNENDKEGKNNSIKGKQENTSRKRNRTATQDNDVEETGPFDYGNKKRTTTMLEGNNLPAIVGVGGALALSFYFGLSSIY